MLPFTNYKIFDCIITFTYLDNGSIDSFTREIMELRNKSSDLDTEVLDITNDTLDANEQRKRAHTMINNACIEKEKLQLQLGEYENHIETISNLKVYQYNEEQSDLNLKKQLLSNLPELIPNAEGLSRSTEVINDIFSNYRATLKRLELLKQENNDLNNKVNQERLLKDIQKLELAFSTNYSQTINKDTFETDKHLLYHPGKLRFYS